MLDQAGVADPIDLTIGDSEAVEWTDGGLIVSSPTLISSGQPATRLVEACQTSNEISIEAWVRPAVADQPGPARLVTLSADSLSRNFTLAQGSGAFIGDVFEVRLRTSETSDNGLPALVSTAGTASAELTHVFYTRDATGQARLFVNGVQESAGLRGGDLSTWDPTMLLGLAQEQNGLAPWLGEFRLVAIYAAALSPDEVLQNFQVGPGDALLSDLQVDVTEDSAVLSWTTSEPATSRVAYGRSGDYELGTVIDESLTTSHVITLEGLEPGRIHYYEVQSITGSGDPITRGNLIFQTYGGAGSGGPSIDVWYGGSQTFGQIGIPQVWVNILGNVADLDGVSSLSYRLNGGVEQPLSLGPDTRRLQDAGDFNIDLLFDELLPGINLVEVTGLDDLGNESVQTVSVHNASGAVWPIPFDVDWSSVSAIEDTAQVVDGLWAIGPEGLSPVLPGYDRIVVIGDVSWTDYEVTVPITLEGIDPRGYFPPSLQPAVGLGVRWHGHIDNGTQPAWAFTAFSGLGAYLLVPGSPKLALYEHPFVLSDSIPFQISLGVTYLWKMRVETLPEGQRHTLKVWIEGEAEPEEWMLTVTDTDAAAPLSGSLMLLAHHVEATFGNLSVVPLAP